MWTGDVSGWAPTADTFFYNRNWCVAGGPQFIKEDGGLTAILPDGNAAAIQVSRVHVHNCSNVPPITTL